MPVSGSICAGTILIEEVDAYAVYLITDDSSASPRPVSRYSGSAQLKGLISCPGTQAQTISWTTGSE